MIDGQAKAEDYEIGDRVVTTRTIDLGAGWAVPLGRAGVVKGLEEGRLHPLVVRFEGGTGDVTVSADEITAGGEG